MLGEVMPVGASLSDQDLKDLRRARLLLEGPTMASKLTQKLGRPVERAMGCLPRFFRSTIELSTTAALNHSVKLASITMRDRAPAPERAAPGMHQMALMVSGGLGGALGLATFLWEIPLSTTLMLRSIADIARSEGFSIRSPETLTACIEVFALEGGKQKDQPGSSNYWAVRLALARVVSEATAALAAAQISQGSGAVIPRLISAVAARFGVILSQQAAAKMIPIAGAAGGMAINLIFIRHFQRMARGHFIIRRLEQTHGPEVIRQLYRSVALPYTA